MSFQVVARTKTAAKCTKMKNEKRTLKTGETTVFIFIFKNANL